MSGGRAFRARRGARVLRVGRRAVACVSRSASARWRLRAFGVILVIQYQKTSCTMASAAGGFRGRTTLAKLTASPCPGGGKSAMRPRLHRAVSLRQLVVAIVVAGLVWGAGGPPGGGAPRPGAAFGGGGG